MGAMPLGKGGGCPQPLYPNLAQAKPQSFCLRDSDDRVTVGKGATHKCSQKQWAGGMGPGTDVTDPIDRGGVSFGGQL